MGHAWAGFSRPEKTRVFQPGLPRGMLRSSLRVGTTAGCGGRWGRGRAYAHVRVRLRGVRIALLQVAHQLELPPAINHISRVDCRQGL
jgi:hypothetical protein